VLFGSEFAANSLEIANAVSVVFGDLRAEILYLPIWRRLPSARSIRWNRAVKRLNRSIGTIIVERQSCAETGNDLLGSLLRAHDSDGYSMSDEQLLDEILTFSLAGHETAALSLTWAAYLIAMHPEMQEQAAEEVFTVTGGGDVRAEHYPHLCFVTAVAKEALRLYPPVWCLGRVATKDSALGSLRVVKGTDLWLCLHRLHRDPRWYPERSDSARSVGLGIKRNGGLPMRHSESALAYVSASTSQWLKPYSDWLRCCAGSASRRFPLFLPKSTRGSRFGQKKGSNSVCNSGTVQYFRSDSQGQNASTNRSFPCHATRRLLQRKRRPILTMSAAGKHLPGRRLLTPFPVSS
jgi:hypothetical protein